MTNYWKFTKFDNLNHPIMSGIMTSLGSYSRQTLQTAFDGVATTATSEERTTTFDAVLGAFYTNTSFPAGTAYTVKEADLRKIMYYDDYLWNTDANYNFQSANAFHAQGFTKGLMTGMFIRNLETNVWYKNINFVDYKGRIIQQHSQNNVGGIDRIDYQYRFNNEVLKMRMTHRKTGLKDLVELYEYSYNHTGVKTSFTHNNLVVAKYDLDGINRLQNKRFRPTGTTQGSKQTGNWTDATSWLSGVFPLANDNVTINTGHTLTIPSGQSGSAGILNDKGTLKNFGTLNMGKIPTVDLYAESYLWHIRGGLRGKNLDASENLTNSLFSLKIEYEGNSGFFDGNIKNQYWKSNIDGVQRAYQYDYDIASRLISGTYGSTKANENYALNGVTYDFNGNILSLSRNGWKSNNTFGLVDNLNYTYNTTSNKILKVDDASGEAASFADATGATDYTYNLDGSLASDANKGISLIEYNYLKLPKRIVKGSTTILNEYDADGNKLKETIGTQVTDYVGNKIYKANVLYQIGHDEGRIIGGEYEYHIKDHLGNLRVAFRDSLGIAKITQSNSYGCWGEDLPTLSYQKSSWNKDFFKFTGKEELQGTGYIDFGARWYDNIVPHFTTIDPLSDKNNFESGYTYVHNNPLKYIDPDGKDGILIVFPDYKIATPAGKIGGLGHAGVLLIDNKTGLTKYYEYGRYDSEGKGLVRTVSVSNIKIGKDGKPTEASLKKVLGQISKKSGHGTRVEGAYIESDNFDAMKSYAEGKIKENSDPDREKYSLTSNNCGTFACDVLNQDSDVNTKSPSISDPRPNSIIQEYQGTYGKVEYNTKTGGTKETVDKSRYQEILNKMKKYFN